MIVSHMFRKKQHTVQTYGLVSEAADLLGLLYSQIFFFLSN